MTPVTWFLGKRVKHIRLLNNAIKSGILRDVDEFLSWILFFWSKRLVCFVVIV
jgi:hypothetical protein